MNLTGASGLSGASVNAVGGTATFPALSINTAGTYALVANAPAVGATSAPSASFTVYDGELKCEPGVPYTFSSFPSGVTNINQPGYAAGQRGMFNKDGSQCIPVGYTFTNDILNTQLGVAAVERPEPAGGRVQVHGRRGSRSTSMRSAACPPA